VFVGKLENDLRPAVEAMGLGANVHFAGLVSEYEKFRLFKASRMFLMPSTYESWGIVIGEAFACGIPVVAYDLAAYRPIFGELVNYVPCFNLQEFQQTASRILLKARSGQVDLDQQALQRLKDEHSWAAARRRFQHTLDEFAR
jgi:glycosyltransferase involved in cell wall biosynthesis